MVGFLSHWALESFVRYPSPNQEGGRAMFGGNPDMIGGDPQMTGGDPPFTGGDPT